MRRLAHSLALLRDVNQCVADLASNDDALARGRLGLARARLTQWEDDGRRKASPRQQTIFDALTLVERRRVRA